jgi:hypothetical protein
MRGGWAFLGLQYSSSVVLFLFVFFVVIVSVVQVVRG